MPIQEMERRSDLRLGSRIDSLEEALLDAVVTSTPLRRSRAFSLPTLKSDGYVYDTGYDTMERAYNEEDDVYDHRELSNMFMFQRWANV